MQPDEEADKGGASAGRSPLWLSGRQLADAAGAFGGGRYARMTFTRDKGVKAKALKISSGAG